LPVSGAGKPLVFCHVREIAFATASALVAEGARVVGDACLPTELGARNVRLNGLLPGRIRTDRMTYLDSLSTSDDQRAPPAASCLTGSMIPADG
jgi:NAD(P)-dependent dehydrogenase (short-subunit alcohol dehydrogenase family)